MSEIEAAPTRAPFPKRLVVVPALIGLAIWLWPSGSHHTSAPAASAKDSAAYMRAFRETAGMAAWWPHVLGTKPIDTQSGGIYVTVTTDLPIGSDGKAADPELAHQVCAAAVGSVDSWKLGKEDPATVSAVVQGPDHALLTTCRL